MLYGKRFVSEHCRWAALTRQFPYYTYVIRARMTCLVAL